MRLIDYYRVQFVEATQLFEPVWTEEQDVGLGYRWSKNNYPLAEQFQIIESHPKQPVLMYSLVLPESYLQTTIYEEIKRNSSPYEISIVILDRKLWLNASMLADHLQSSIIGFLNQTRGELVNILDCVIQRTEDKLVQVHSY